MAEHKKHGAGIYVVVALILAVLTYVEFAIVEYPVAWLSSGQVMFWLIALSLVKFWMVIWFFMHLRDDPKLYTGFFSSGMLISMGTFVALSFMFILPGAVAPNANAEEVDARDRFFVNFAAGGHAAVKAANKEVFAARAQAGNAIAPADRTLAVTPPAAADEGFDLDLEARAADPEPAPEAPAATEPASDAPVAAQGEADPGYDAELGATTYAANCAGCHQATGAGIPGVFPPLAGHAADVYAATGGIGGRAFLIDVLVYGLQGAITVDGASYNGLMPGWQQLNDAQIASVINHIVAGFDGAPEGFDAIRADEVAAARGQGLNGGDVHELRGALGLE